MKVRNRLQRISVLDVLASITGASIAGRERESAIKLAATWHQTAPTPLHFQKTLIGFATKDEALRRNAEDKFAARLPNGVSAFRVLAASSDVDNSRLRRHVRELGFDGAVVMRVVDVDSRIAYLPGSYCDDATFGFYRHWGSAWATAFDPCSIVQDRLVSIETRVYSLPRNQLIWAGRSEPTSSRRAGELADSVIEHVVDALHVDGLLSPMPSGGRACAGDGRGH